METDYTKLTENDFHSIIQAVRNGAGSNKAIGYQRRYRSRDLCILTLIRQPLCFKLVFKGKFIPRNIYLFFLRDYFSCFQFGRVLYAPSNYQYVGK